MASMVSQLRNRDKISGPFIGRELDFPHNEHIRLRVNQEPVDFQFVATLAIRHIPSLDLNLMRRDLTNVVKANEFITKAGVYNKGLILRRGRLEVAPIGHDDSAGNLGFLLSADVLRAYDSYGRDINIAEEQDRLVQKAFGNRHIVSTSAGKLTLGAIITSSFGKANSFASMLNKGFPDKLYAGPVDLLGSIGIPHPR